MLTEQETQLLKSSFNTWNAIRQLRGETFADPKDFDLVAREAVKFGAPDVSSAWARALFELEREKLVKPQTPAPIPPAFPSDFEQQVRQMSSSQLLKRLNQDADFASLFERFSCGEKPEGFVADEEYTLTTSQWHSMPPAVASVKMRDPKFRKAVNKLISDGSI